MQSSNSLYVIEKRVFDKHGEVLGYIVDLNGQKSFLNRSNCYYSVRNGWVKDVKPVSELDFSITGSNGFKLRDLPSVNENDMCKEMSTWCFLEKPFFVCQEIKYVLNSRNRHFFSLCSNSFLKEVNWYTQGKSSDHILGIIVQNKLPFPLELNGRIINPKVGVFISLKEILNNIDYYKGLIDGLSNDINYNSNRDKFNLDIRCSSDTPKYDSPFRLLTLYGLNLENKKVSKNSKEISKLIFKNLELDIDKAAKDMLFELLNILNSGTITLNSVKNNPMGTTVKKPNKFMSLFGIK